MTTIQTLTAARELLAEPARWTKGQNARTASGRPVFPEHKTATCWCSAGAIKVGKKAAGRDIEGRIYDHTPWPRHREMLAAIAAGASR